MKKKIDKRKSKKNERRKEEKKKARTEAHDPEIELPLRIKKSHPFVAQLAEVGLGHS